MACKSYFLTGEPARTTVAALLGESLVETNRIAAVVCDVKKEG